MVSSSITLLISILVFSGPLIRYILRQRKGLNLPRIGPKPGVLGNTTKGYFYNHSLELVREGYERVRFCKVDHVRIDELTQDI